MVEYGHGVGQSTGQTGGGGGAGGGGANLDFDGAIGNMIGDAVNTVAALPPEMLLLGAVALFLGFVFFKRAF
jgi:hypothetical protein